MGDLSVNRAANASGFFDASEAEVAVDSNSRIWQA